MIAQHDFLVNTKEQVYVSLYVWIKTQERNIIPVQLFREKRTSASTCKKEDSPVVKKLRGGSPSLKDTDKSLGWMSRTWDGADCCQPAWQSWPPSSCPGTPRTPCCSTAPCCSPPSPSQAFPRDEQSCEWASAVACSNFLGRRRCRWGCRCGRTWRIALVI